MTWAQGQTPDTETLFLIKSAVGIVNKAHMTLTKRLGTEAGSSTGGAQWTQPDVWTEVMDLRRTTWPEHHCSHADNKYMQLVFLTVRCTVYDETKTHNYANRKHWSIILKSRVDNGATVEDCWEDYREPKSTDYRLLWYILLWSISVYFPLSIVHLIM